MRVEVRAVIMIDGKLVTTVERRRGEPHSALPGGGVKRWETLEQGLVREVSEETGLIVTPGPLVYVAQVVSRYSLHDLNLVFLATIDERSEDAEFDLIDPNDGDHILPPVLKRIAQDAPLEWRDGPEWLGNIFNPDRPPGP